MSESFTHSDIVLAIGGGEAVRSIVQCFCLAVEASAVVNQLDLEFVSLMYALSEGATFSGNRLDIKSNQHLRATEVEAGDLYAVRHKSIA